VKQKTRFQIEGFVKRNSPLVADEEIFFRFEAIFTKEGEKELIV
jgi:hypothetical protein